MSPLFRYRVCNAVRDSTAMLLVALVITTASVRAEQASGGNLADNHSQG